MNIISGRISSRLLHKILNRTDIHSLIDENEEIDEEFEDIQIVTEYSSQVFFIKIVMYINLGYDKNCSPIERWKRFNEKFNNKFKE